MTTIVTRASKGSPLTNAEMDANLNNLNTDKLEVATAASTYQPLDSDLTAIAALATNGFARRTGAGTWVIDTTIAGSYISGAIDSVTVGLTTPAAARVTSLLVNAASFLSTETLRVTGAVNISGTVGLFGPFNAAHLVSIGGSNIHSGSATSIFAAVAQYTAPSTATVGASGFVSVIASQAAVFTMGNLTHFEANQTVKGAGSTITTVIGFRANGSIATGTNNYGFYSNIASAATTWQIYMAGSAGNYLASNLRIGTTALVGSEALRVAGVTNTDGLIVNLTAAINPVTVGSMDNVVIGAASAQNANFAAVGVRIAIDSTHSIKAAAPNSSAVGVVTVGVDATCASTATSFLTGFKSTLGSAVAAFTVIDVAHFQAATTTAGAGSTITNAYGLKIDSTIAAGTNNYGVYCAVAPATNNYGLYFAGLAKNYLGGVLAVCVAPQTYNTISLGMANTTSTIARGVSSYLSGTTFQTSTLTGVYQGFGTAAAAYTTSGIYHFHAAVVTKGAGSTISSIRGFYADNQIAVGSNNYGFYSDIASAANTWQLYMNGTASSYFAGPLIMATGVAIEFSATDTTLVAPTFGILELKGGTLAQAFRVYGTTTGPRYVSLSHDGTNAILDTASASGRLSLGGNATSIFGLSHLLFTDNTFDIGASGATRPRSIFVAASVTAATSFIIGSTKVVGARDTGWSAMTGSTNKATVYDTATVTTAQLAGRVMALQAALTTHGLLGA